MSHAFSGGLPSPSRIRGAVLAVVLIVLIVMMLGGLSMFRSIDTSALLAGNLAFKRDSINRSSIGLNAAFTVMTSSNFTNPEIADCVPEVPTCHGVAKVWKEMNYSPRLLEADMDGIPLIIKDKAAFDRRFSANLPSVTAGTRAAGNEVRFLIERMCTDFGPADEKKCSVSDNFERGGSYRQEKPGALSLPLYRVTIRSDGVRNTQTYVQATITARLP